MLTDAHIHFIPEEIASCTSFFKGAWSDKQKLYDFMDNQNIEKALLVYPSTDAHLKLGIKKEVSIYNRSVEQILKENSKIIAACLVDIEDLSDVGLQLAELKK